MKTVSEHLSAHACYDLLQFVIMLLGGSAVIPVAALFFLMSCYFC